MTFDKLGFGSSAARLFLLAAGGALVLATMAGGFTAAYAPGAAFSDEYSWLASNWMFLHGTIGSLALFLLLSDPAPSSPDWLAMLLAAVYCSHQWEEHAWDATGRRFPFIFHLGKIMGCTLAIETEPRLKATGDCGVDENVLLWINVYAVMGLFLAPLLLPPKAKRMLVAMNAMMAFVNAALFHIVAALVHGHYNPGLVQSTLLNAPLALWVLHRLHAGGMVSAPQIVIAFLVNGLPGQPILALGPMLAAKGGLLTHYTQHAFQASLLLVALPTIAVLGARLGPGKRKGP